MDGIEAETTITNMLSFYTQTFVNCACVAESFYSNASNISYDDTTVTNMSTASNGRCEHDCFLLPPFIIIIVIVLFILSTVHIPVSYFTMRYVYFVYMCLYIEALTKMVRSMRANS